MENRDLYIYMMDTAATDDAFGKSPSGKPPRNI
jgi:hypothetical protein